MTSSNNRRWFKIITISVLLPVHNGQHYIAHALQSVLEQKQVGGEFEVLVLDDASTDDSWRIIRSLLASYPNRSVKLIRNMSSRGLFYAHNTLWDRAQGTYVKFMHQDDIMPPNALLKWSEEIAKYPEIPLIMSPAVIIDGRGETLGTFPWGLTPGKTWEAGTISLLSSELGNVIGNPPSVLIKNSSLRFNNHRKNSSDWALNLDLSENHTTQVTNIPLIKWRMHNGSESTKNNLNFSTMFEDFDIVHDFGRSYLHNVTAGLWRLVVTILAHVFHFVRSGDGDTARNIFAQLMARHDDSIPYIWADLVNMHRLLSIDDIEGFFHYMNHPQSSLIQLAWRGVYLSWDFYRALNSSPSKTWRIIGHHPSIPLTRIIEIFGHEVTSSDNATASVITIPDRMSDFILWHEMRMKFPHAEICRGLEWIL